MNELMIYQIGNSKRMNEYRYIITHGFDNESVESCLKTGEFIDTVDVLSAILKGDVEIVESRALVTVP